MCHQLRTGLAVGVGIIAVKLLILSVAPFPLVVLIDLVGGDIQERTDTGAVS